MAIKGSGRKIYKTMQGKQIDLDLLIKRNEMTPAVGNVRVNARGDELGPGGKIVRKREEVVRDYYKKNKTITNEQVSAKKNDLSAAEAQQLAEFDDEPVPVKKTTQTRTNTKVEPEWVEDENGNFVKKGE